MEIVNDADLIKDIPLKDCPFCGHLPLVGQIGNNYTKKRSVYVKCTGCGVQYLQSAFKQSIEWLEGKVCEMWNRRH